MKKLLAHALTAGVAAFAVAFIKALGLPIGDGTIQSLGHQVMVAIGGG